MKVTSTSVLALKAMETLCRFNRNKVRSPKHVYFAFLLHKQHGREVMSCCHCMTTLPKRPLVPTWLFFNSIITPRRKPVPVSPLNPTHSHHAATAKTWNLMAKRTPTRSRQQPLKKRSGGNSALPRLAQQIRFNICGLTPSSG